MTKPNKHPKELWPGINKKCWDSMYYPPPLPKEIEDQMANYGKVAGRAAGKARVRVIIGVLTRHGK